MTNLYNKFIQIESFHFYKTKTGCKIMGHGYVFLIQFSKHCMVYQIHNLKNHSTVFLNNQTDNMADQIYNSILFLAASL